MISKILFCQKYQNLDYSNYIFSNKLMIFGFHIINSKINIEFYFKKLILNFFFLYFRQR